MRVSRSSLSMINLLAVSTKLSISTCSCDIRFITWLVLISDWLSVSL